MFLAARSLTFSFCWFMLYNRLGRRKTFAMYRQNIVHEWMIVFAVLRGLACEWASWGAGPDGSVFYYQLFTSNFYFFKHLKILHFFLPASSIVSIDSLPLPPRPSIVKHNLCNGVQPDRGSHCLDISDFCELVMLMQNKICGFKMQNIWITWLRHNRSPSKHNNNPVWRQLKKWCNFLLQHRNFDTVRFVIMDITNGRVA